MWTQYLLGLLARVGFAGIGLLAIYHGLSRSEYRSLWMRLRGEPAVPISRIQRSLIVAMGASLFVLSLLLALGIVR